MSTDVEAARERALRNDAEALATAADRLASAGRFEAAARDWRRAAEMSPDVDRAAALRKKASDARGRGRASRVFKRMLWMLVLSGLVVLLAWMLTPLIHNFLAERSLRSLAEVRDEQVRIDRLRLFAQDQAKPYPWYERVFRGTYVIKAANEANLQADEFERSMRLTSTGPHTESSALRDLEEAYADPRVAWQPVLDRASALLKSGSARERDRAREIQTIVQSQLSKMTPELQWIEAMRKEGRFREALERAAQFRSSFPRAGSLASGLPLAARVEVISEEGKPIPAAEIRVDGAPLSAGDRHFCRRGNAESIVEVAAAGYAPFRHVVPADLDPAEVVVRVSLRVATVWKRAVGSKPPLWTVLHHAPDGVYAHRPDGIYLLRANDGDQIAAFTLPAAADAVLTPLWLEDRGRLLISGDDGQVRNLDGRTLTADHVLLRALAGVHAWMEAPLTYRASKIVRYLVQETRESREAKAARFVVAMDGAQELWSYKGISGRSQTPVLLHHLDRVVVIDDTSAHFIEEDGSSVQILDLLEARVGPPLIVSKPGAKADDRAILMPTVAGIQWIRFGPRSAPMESVADPVLDAAGAALAAVDGDTVALARSDHGLDLVVYRENLSPAGEPPRPGFQRVWHADTGRAFGAPPVVGANVVVTLDDQGRLSTWARDSGALLGRIAHGAPIASAPLVRDGNIILVDSSGGIVAYAIPGR
ncbi:MAG: PQQ-binding-like beta-propeller repeat protein [Planctomycetes bacterium]|nr:PQQ-binding-like beta-propeller repeat protein [Planctomycetota bacterium]